MKAIWDFQFIFHVGQGTDGHIRISWESLLMHFQGRVLSL